MAFLGTLFNVAKVGVGLLNSVINQPQVAANKMNWYIELDSGKKITTMAKFILVHPNARKVGTCVAGFAPPDEGEVSFVLAKEPDGSQGLFAINNDPAIDYYLSFTQTGGTGNTATPQYIINHANQPFNPNYLDVTSEFNSYKDGNIVVSPAQITQPTLSGAPIPTSTLLANFGVNSVLATAVYTLYSSKAGTVKYSWETAADGSTITGCSVSNGLNFPISVNANLAWDSPSQAFPANFIAAAGTSSAPKSTSFAFASTDRPLSQASIAISAANTAPHFVREIIKDQLEAQRAAGKLHYVK
jgi:hypothetical protein